MLWDEPLGRDDLSDLVRVDRVKLAARCEAGLVRAQQDPKLAMRLEQLVDVGHNPYSHLRLIGWRLK